MPPPINKSGGITGQNSGSSSRSTAAPPPPKAKPSSGGTSHWLDTLDDVKIAQPDQPTPSRFPTSPVSRDTLSRPGGHHSSGNSSGGYRGEGGRGPTAYRESDSRGRPSGTFGTRPRQPFERGPEHKAPGRPGGAQPRGKVKIPKPSPEPRPKKEKIAPPQPIVPTPEQVTQVETRYLELATPAEFDGIRTQISKELGLPKKAVKTIIKALRERQHIPSWWETQTYKGSTEELETIKASYLPYLPVPPVGVHKTIADQLKLKAGEVYQAIKAIRLEMKLPQYNDPVLHEKEFELIRQAREKKQSEAVPAAETSSQASE